MTHMNLYNQYTYYNLFDISNIIITTKCVK